VAVRVRIRIEAPSLNNVAESSALVNTGFETERPQLVLPRRLAEKLQLWPPPREAEVVVLGTAGGPSRMYLVKNGLDVSILVGGEARNKTVCDALISDIEEEVLINDKLGEELGIVIERMASGDWRLSTDTPEVRRKSEKPEYWS